MADNIGINRVPTAEERSDYSQVGTKTPKVQFLAELSKVSAKFTKEHLPFDAQCARLDYADKVENIEKESQRIHGYVRPSDISRLKLDNLESYGDPKRFDLVEDDEEIEQQNINGTKTAIVTGHTVKYVCKERGHGCSVFIPMELYTERFLDKDKKKGKEE